MIDFVRLLDIVKEYSKDVHADYDRETVLVFLRTKYLQDFLVQLDRLPCEILFKIKLEGDLLCVLVGFDPSLLEMDQFDD